MFPSGGRRGEERRGQKRRGEVAFSFLRRRQPFHSESREMSSAPTPNKNDDSEDVKEATSSAPLSSISKCNLDISCFRAEAEPERRRGRGRPLGQR